MATKITPFGVDLTYGDDKGADNWNIWTDLNYLTLGATLQIGVKSFTTFPLPSPVNGERWIIPSGPSSNQIAAAVEGTYNYFTPAAGFRAVVEDTEQHIFFDGLAWQDEDDYGVLI